MRTLQETQERWQVTQRHSATLAELRQAVKSNSLSSPCLSGCRSVCWKVFLLTDEGPTTSWTGTLGDGRRLYQEKRGRFMKYIWRPEALAELEVDPLADDPESPWNAVRQDEIMRAEIQQDVQRLPDEVNYHEPAIQRIILDILFVYCKAYPERGGYRQGMHELLAPIVYVVEQDSLDTGSTGDGSQLDQVMLNVMDASFVEHDAYILFDHLMQHAQPFYEVTERGSSTRLAAEAVMPKEQRSAIVDKSKHIHEVCLQKVDPELATHLSAIEILPQIFLIRWIRLLFSREFPFHQLLVLWDTIFAADPTLSLIDLICVAMLIRIRWQVLEADYSVCLQLLLKYPNPEPPHGPHTFIDDALYLRENMDASGGSELISKYTGKSPDNTIDPSSNPDQTPTRAGDESQQRVDVGKSSMPSFRPPQASVETILHGAAKRANRVFERSEKLGINQAVRDAMGEIRRNVQSFNEARQAQRHPRSILSDEGAAKALAAMERRNRQLAGLLNDTVTNLKTVSMSDFEEKSKSLELIEVAAAKIQFVQVYLEDSTMDVPVLDASTTELPRTQSPSSNTDMEVTEPSPDSPAERDREDKSAAKATKDDAECSDTLTLPTGAVEGARQAEQPEQGGTASDSAGAVNPPTLRQISERRPAAVPTRSTLAQSSFSWMLEPDESAPSTLSAATPRSPPSQHKKRGSSNMSRERNAFLFGQETADVEGSSQPVSDDIFGMEPISRTKMRSPATLFDES